MTAQLTKSENEVRRDAWIQVLEENEELTEKQVNRIILRIRAYNLIIESQ